MWGGVRAGFGTGAGIGVRADSGVGVRAGIGAESELEPNLGLGLGWRLDLGLHLGSALGLGICSTSCVRAPPQPTETGTMLWWWSDMTLLVRERGWAAPSAFLSGSRLWNSTTPSWLETPLRRGRGAREGGSEPGNWGTLGLLRVSSPCCPREARCWAAPCRRDAAAGARQPPSP